MIQTFVEGYKQRYGNTLPDAHAALAYDATRLLVDAITRAGTTESSKLREALATTKYFKGVTGDINMDKDRNAVKPAVDLKLQDTRYIYETKIYPQPENPPSTIYDSSPSPSPSAKGTRARSQ